LRVVLLALFAAFVAEPFPELFAELLAAIRLFSLERDAARSCLGFLKPTRPGIPSEATRARVCVDRPAHAFCIDAPTGAPSC
jgi:hypothetical protein